MNSLIFNQNSYLETARSFDIKKCSTTKELQSWELTNYFNLFSPKRSGNLINNTPFQHKFSDLWRIWLVAGEEIKPLSKESIVTGKSHIIVCLSVWTVQLLSTEHKWEINIFNRLSMTNVTLWHFTTCVCNITARKGIVKFNQCHFLYIKLPCFYKQK